jgi:hypothetical protein
MTLPDPSQKKPADAADTALSAQERHDLRAAELGYDDSASALPGPDEGESQADLRAKTPSLPAGLRSHTPHSHPAPEAHPRGLRPEPGNAGPPLDATDEGEEPD